MKNYNLIEMEKTGFKPCKVALTFNGLDTYPSDLIIAGLELAEEALHLLESRLIEDLLVHEDMEQVLFAARAEMSGLRRKHLQFQNARSGSLILLGVFGVASWWVLDKTLGESVKEAYKKSELHARLTRFFSSDLSQFAHDLGEAIQSILKDRRRTRNLALAMALSRIDISVERLFDDQRFPHGTVEIRLWAKQHYQQLS